MFIKKLLTLLFKNLSNKERNILYQNTIYFLGLPEVLYMTGNFNWLAIPTSSLLTFQNLSHKPPKIQINDLKVLSESGKNCCFVFSSSLRVSFSVSHFPVPSLTGFFLIERLPLCIFFRALLVEKVEIGRVFVSSPSGLVMHVFCLSKPATFSKSYDNFLSLSFWVCSSDLPVLF